MYKENKVYPFLTASIKIFFDLKLGPIIDIKYLRCSRNETVQYVFKSIILYLKCPIFE